MKNIFIEFLNKVDEHDKAGDKVIKAFIKAKIRHTDIILFIISIIIIFAFAWVMMYPVANLMGAF